MFDDFNAMMPWVVLSIGVLVTLLVSVIRVDSTKPAGIAASLTLILTLFSAWKTMPAVPLHPFHGMLEVSDLTLSSLVFLSGTGLLFLAGASRYLTREGLHLSDFYHLVLILILGASVLVCSRDLLVSFIALEVMSLPAYTLAGFRRNDSRSNEAAIKYFILGGAAGAVFLLGSSFLYGATGSMDFGTITEWSRTHGGRQPLFWIGHVLVLGAFLFKVAAAPLHFWKPDVYEGAPVPVTGIMSVIVGSSAFIALIRLLHLPDLLLSGWMEYAGALRALFRVLAGMSLVTGALVMITQKNFKRLMAYSSISHTGYLLLGVLATFSDPAAVSSVLIYLFGYGLMATGFFALLAQTEGAADSSVELVDVTGLMKRAPLKTVLWTVFLFSMSGMPFTIGFFTKLSVFMAAIGVGETGIVILAALCTVVGAYAYLRPVALMVMRDSDPGAGAWSSSFGSQMVAAGAAIAVVILGILPNAVIHYLKGIPLIH